ncbi:MAG: hypothetical protein ACRD3W_20090, partial [Terriglobales bacterium]
MRLAAVATTLLIVASIGLYKLCFPLRMTVDCLELLRFGQLIAAGKVPYVDVIHAFNPPAIQYLNVLPAVLSRLSGIHVIPSLIFCVWLLCLYSAVASIAALRGSVLRERAVVPIAILSVSAAILPLCKLLFFGQREMLLVLCFLPFFWLRWIRWQGGSSGTLKATIIGTIAGIGLCLKPHFLLLPLCTELYWIAKVRSIRQFSRAEIAACAGVGLIYLAHFCLWTPDMRQEFFGVIVPLALGGYSIPAPAATLSFSCHTYQFWLTILTASLAVVLYRRCSMFGPLLAFTCGGLLVYFFQYKPYLYHLSAFYAGGTMLLACELCVIASLLVRAGESNPASMHQPGGCAKGLSILTAFCLGLAVLAFAVSFAKLSGDRTSAIANG